ncbi:MAG: transcription termination/antitermination protein NusG [Mycoplasma sp.]|nr:transcription termination/antitermination protein NusG [Mycoplasma sp.]
MKKWYMISTIAGKEKQAIELLKTRVQLEKKSSEFESFEIMTIPVITSKEWEKKQKKLKYRISEKNLYPGYIFIKMEMTNDNWFLVRNTENITGLVGSSGQHTKPTPISLTEMAKMKKRVEKIKKDFESGIIVTPFKVGTLVEIIDGPSKGQTGTIIEKNDFKKKAVVEIIMFGRKTNADMPYEYFQIKK